VKTSCSEKYNLCVFRITVSQLEIEIAHTQEEGKEIYNGRWEREMRNTVGKMRNEIGQ
jgi:hypothetical protein